MIVLYNCGTKKRRRKKSLAPSPAILIGYVTAAYTLKKRFFFVFVVVCVATWISYIVYMSL